MASNQYGWIHPYVNIKEKINNHVYEEILNEINNLNTLTSTQLEGITLKVAKYITNIFGDFISENFTQCIKDKKLPNQLKRVGVSTVLKERKRSWQI